ncbi:MAG: GGDEF domain-containing protein [Pseudomonadota bacterium]|nr:GGDEF domain-containing protein [Pseudomonadota bacterium]
MTPALTQSRQIQERLKQTANELSSANASMKRELAMSAPSPEMEVAFKQSTAVEKLLYDTLEELTGVNRTLEDEVRAHSMADHQLAAAVEQEGGARNAAFHDSMTSLPNRALLVDRLEHGIAQAKRYGWILAVMFVDLDKFKRINDELGHDAGDAVLRAIAKRLKDNTREEDTVSRWGGDEFVYLLARIHEQNDIAMIAGKLLRAVQVPCDLSIGERIVNPNIQASIGISIFPKNGVTAALLMKKADEAMYRAKRSNSGYQFAD